MLRHFGSLRRVRDATPEELAQVEGFGPRQAAAVHAFFHRPDVPLDDAAAPVGDAASAGAPGAAGEAGEAGEAELIAAASEAEIDAALAEDDARPPGTA